MQNKGCFQCNVLVSSFRSIWIPVLWVYGLELEMLEIRNVLIFSVRRPFLYVSIWRLYASDSDVYRRSAHWKNWASSNLWKSHWNKSNIFDARCLVILFLCLFFVKYIFIFRLLKLEIALAIPASNDGEIRTVKSAWDGLFSDEPGHFNSPPPHPRSVTRHKWLPRACV